MDLVNADVGAAKLAREVDEEASLAALSVITVHEYLFGVYFRYRADGDKLREKLASAESDLSRFEIIAFTQEAAKISSRTHADLAKTGRQIGINDIYIAATAAQYNLTLVTRNREHFRRIRGLKLESY